MTARISRRGARSAAAQLEIDRAIVARRLSGLSAERTARQLRSLKPTTPFGVHTSEARRRARTRSDDA